jgi:spore germination protein YaaH
MKSWIQIFILLMSAFKLCAQQDSSYSIMQEESRYYSVFGKLSEKQFDSVQIAMGNATDVSFSGKSAGNATCTLQKRVFGWHPYWMGTSYTSYQWNLLSDLCYFDYAVNPSTGQNTNTSFAWNTASVVTVAKNNGVKVHICASLFGSHGTFWSTPTAQTTFINNIITLLNNRGGDGVNIDFEGMGASDKVPFTNFITNLNTALQNANPSYQLSVCLYSVDWSAVFDMPALNAQVDFFTIMGYDYYYSGSAWAGPTAPLYNFQTSYNYTLPKSISYYIRQGAPASKLLLGLPYYGREWEVNGTLVPAQTTNGFTASRTLSYIMNNPATYSASVKFWDGISYTPYYRYLSGSSNRQCFVDDVYSLGRKYDMVNQRGLAGIGIWALGYDNGITSYWDLLKDKFSSCKPQVCADSLFDMGGPARNYYDHEQYAYTLSAGVGQKVQIQFSHFNTELNYDSLWLYNGSSVNTPLIGVYTGNTSPGYKISSGQHMTIRFKSDGNTVASGFKANWSCYTSLATSLEEQAEHENGLKLWPVPCVDELTVQHHEVLQKILLSDASGKVIREYNVPGHSSFRISVKELPAGIYFLGATTANGNTHYRKLMVVKD